VSVAARIAGHLVVWLLVAVPTGIALFFNSTTTTVVASHDAVLRPTADGWATIHTGVLLPDIRVPSGARLGVDVTLGKTEAKSITELTQRYAFIASQPEGQAAKVRTELGRLAWVAALRAGLLALVPLLVWHLVGARRRRELLDRTPWQAGAVLVVLAGFLMLVWLVRDDGRDSPEASWLPLGNYLEGVAVPAEAAQVEVSTDVTTAQARRLIASATDGYDDSLTFYADAAEAASRLRLRQPAEGETVAILVSDRHDNIGMDRVSRAIAEAGGATVVLDAGDDTSTGNSWEAFSLDSMNRTFEDFLRFSIAGNHDHGDFVSDYLADLGWNTFDGDVLRGPGGATILGADDPRSSGLGNWRDETDLSFDDQADLIADDLCAATPRVSTLLVHDVDSGTPALERGCVDLVLGGHLHVQVGPTRVLGANGQVGYVYTNGTTGGAAYAIAIGKIRRPAQVTLVTYRAGRPVGLQPVLFQTTGTFVVSDYIPLTYSRPSSATGR